MTAWLFCAKIGSTVPATPMLNEISYRGQTYGGVRFTADGMEAFFVASYKGKPPRLFIRRDRALWEPIPVTSLSADSIDRLTAAATIGPKDFGDFHDRGVKLRAERRWQTQSARIVASGY